MPYDLAYHNSVSVLLLPHQAASASWDGTTGAGWRGTSATRLRATTRYAVVSAVRVQLSAARTRAAHVVSVALPPAASR